MADSNYTKMVFILTGGRRVEKPLKISPSAIQIKACLKELYSEKYLKVSTKKHKDLYINTDHIEICFFE